MEELSFKMPHFFQKLTPTERFRQRHKRGSDRRWPWVWAMSLLLGPTFFIEELRLQSWRQLSHTASILLGDYREEGSWTVPHPCTETAERGAAKLHCTYPARRLQGWGQPSHITSTLLGHCRDGGSRVTLHPTFSELSMLVRAGSIGCTSTMWLFFHQDEIFKKT